LRQFGTFGQGWISWFCQKAIETKNNRQTRFTISGNGKQVRDVLHADDTVNLYFKAAKNIDKIKGEAFNIGGGMENSLSLLELFDFLEKELDIRLNYKKLAPRESDQKIFSANTAKIDKFLNWRPEINYKTGIRQTLEWLKTAFLL
jgi:CDP-paratose 2-epimerase